VAAVPYDLRHTFVSLLIHEGRSVPYVAALAGHSPRVCLERYAHTFAEADVATATPMLDAIRAARAALDEERGVRPECAVRVLRSSA
jgi:integrase